MARVGRALREARLSTWLALASVAAVAVYVVRVRVLTGFAPAHDVYAYFYPKALYALDSLREGGRGLLWNPYLNCGQPFFAISQTGILYPPFWLFLVFEPEHALQAVLALQLIIGGVGAFLLCRELGARPLAAIAGALTFQLSHAMVGLSASSPTHSAPFAWLPLIMFVCERMLRAPTLQHACALALLLALAILPGMPQTVFFTYQVIALRVLYELLTRRVANIRRLLLLFGLGVLLPVPLAAVQLLPELENAAASLRSARLNAIELDPYGAWTMKVFRDQLENRLTTQPFILVPSMLALTGLLARSTRRLTAFYAALAAICVLLALGTGTTLYDWYSSVPLAGAFRMPSRFLWIVGFCSGPLIALGIEAIASQPPRAPAWRTVATVALVGTPLFVLSWLTPKGFTTVEWIAALLVLGAAISAVLVDRALRWVPGVLLAGLLLQLLFGPYFLHVHLMAAPPNVLAAEGALAPLRDQFGPEDRLYLIYDRGYGFMAKSASLVRMPAVLDYEPLTTRRFAEYSVMMRTGSPMLNANNFIYSGPRLGPAFSRRLLDLTAARFLVVTEADKERMAGITPPLREVQNDGWLTIYENEQRLPRAFYVPRVEVVPDPAVLLQRLASGTDDLRRVALVEEQPRDSFVGSDAPTDGASVRFTINDPEEVVLEVDAPARGFLVLSDQYFAGWTATVDSNPVAVQRANYAFRAVEVPAGHSTVVFRYVPTSLRIGAGVSALSLIAVAGLLLYSRRRGAARSG